MFDNAGFMGLLGRSPVSFETALSGGVLVLEPHTCRREGGASAGQAGADAGDALGASLQQCRRQPLDLGPA
jgi:hypothetical protein